jgi:4-hydroxy-tetrahydrodipicolinate synthase
MESQKPLGILAATATPLNADLSVHPSKLIAHCRRLLDTGCDGINLLGTTGEATSLSVAERLATMRTFAQSGLPLERCMVGTGAAALADAVTLTQAAVDLGFGGALLLPPFYYKGVDAPALIAFVDAVIERVQRSALRLYLYHFPQNTVVPYTLDVVTALRERHPQIVVGLKDSSGDLDNAARIAQALPGFDVFPGTESALTDPRRELFAGCISATANVTAPYAGPGWHGRATKEGQQQLQVAALIRAALTNLPVIAAVKWTLAQQQQDPGWQRLLPPLRALDATQAQALHAALAATPLAPFARAGA